MDAYTIPADRLARMDPTTRAVLALITTGITGGALREADRDPLDIYDALEAVDALHSAGGAADRRRGRRTTCLHLGARPFRYSLVARQRVAAPGGGPGGRSAARTRDTHRYSCNLPARHGSNACSILGGWWWTGCRCGTWLGRCRRRSSTAHASRGQKIRRVFERGSSTVADRMSRSRVKPSPGPLEAVRIRYQDPHGREGWAWVWASAVTRH